MSESDPADAFEALGQLELHPEPQAVIRGGRQGDVPGQHQVAVFNGSHDAPVNDLVTVSGCV